MVESCKVDANATDKKVQTTLQLVAQHLPITLFYPLQLIVNNVLDLNARDKENKAPLYYACDRLSSDEANRVALMLLFDNRINVNAQDNKGKTPFYHATIKNNTDIILKMIEKG